jgi:hypothetical protein
LSLHLHSQEAWRGEIVFDQPRHRLNVGLVEDYPRLNQWPEWWTAEPDLRYAVSMPEGTLINTVGSKLGNGLPISLAPNAPYAVRVCPD